MDSLEELRGEEYQMQHFGVTTSLYTNEVKEMLMAVMEECIKDMEKALHAKFPGKNKEIEIASQKLIEEYAKEADKLSATLKEKLNNTFLNIPSFVLLKDDEAHVNQYSNEVVNKIDLDIAKLQIELIKGQFMEAKLKQVARKSIKCLASFLKLKAGYNEDSSNVEDFEMIKKMVENISKSKEDYTKVFGETDVAKVDSSDNEEELWEEKFNLKT